jgi:type IV secretory pathway component VirB8
MVNSWYNRVKKSERELKMLLIIMAVFTVLVVLSAVATALE